ncbi:serine/threonine-protein kinase [Curtobacterium sp. MCPF17_052]|uniref:serine/threonine-protein kinase n=1 Tax=Curtobacterium sp. MCPF17_052 TaxID=2175655 RepID=UPI0024E03079|nr:serine/threonine-protein kinase [Curtobacterium sp. MCPF17_052]WIB13784.1 serine/threonine-protein kinase [Curtobacterium sp. MCPF17_052]
MASVYRAVDEQLGREVAVKLFRIGPVDHGERARAEAEIHVLAGLRSPNLVTLFDAALDDVDGDSFLVMELVPGSDLATRLREGPLDPTTTARVGAQVAEGLAAVHAQGIVHRDVKPANVLLEQDGEHVKLADFGIALLRDAARVTGTGTVIGTAAYLAPEQVLGQPVTGEADVYALGLMLLEALTGKQAFPGSAVEAATARLARAPEIDQHLPTAWRTLLHVMTAQHPEDRPSAAEAAARLRALGRDEVAPATQLLPGGPGGSHARRRRCRGGRCSRRRRGCRNRIRGRGDARDAGAGSLPPGRRHPTAPDPVPAGAECGRRRGHHGPRDAGSRSSRSGWWRRWSCGRARWSGPAAGHGPRRAPAEALGGGADRPGGPRGRRHRRRGPRVQP